MTYENLKSCKPIIPGLAITIKCSGPKDLDVLAAPLPEGYRLLEWMIEIVVLPVCDVVCELVSSQYLQTLAYRLLQSSIFTYQNRPIKLNLNII